MPKYKIICMSFDGEYKTERPVFDSIEDAWEYSGDLGSKWFFYPFHFVVTESGRTIKDSAPVLRGANNRRVFTIANIFEAHSKATKTHGMNCKAFAFSVPLL